MGLGVALFGVNLWERNGTERDRLVSVTWPMSAEQDWAGLPDTTVLIYWTWSLGGIILTLLCIGRIMGTYGEWGRWYRPGVTGRKTKVPTLP